MAFEKLRTIVTTAIPKPRSARLPKPPQLPAFRLWEKAARNRGQRSFPENAH
jgi:hypothetical protein